MDADSYSQLSHGRGQSLLNLNSPLFGDVQPVNTRTLLREGGVGMGRVLTLLFVALLWTPSAKADSPQQPLHVAFINPGKTGEAFWDLVSDTMRAAAKQLNIDVEISYAERNRRTLIDLGLEIVHRASPPDYLIVVNEESAATPIVEAANAAKVKTLLLSNAFMGDEALAYGEPRKVLKYWIGSLLPDMRAAGARMAKALVDASRDSQWRSADGKIHLLALAGDETTPNSIARTAGFTSYVEKQSDVVIDRLLFANWNASEAETLADRYLHWAQRSNIRPAGVWAANDLIALGAMKAMHRAGLSPGRDIGVVGLNWSPEGLEAVQARRMIVTDGGHFFEGGWAMVLIRDHADGCDFARTNSVQEVPLAAIDHSNVTDLADLIKSRRFDRIRFASFLAAPSDRCGDYDFSLDAILRALRTRPAK